MKLTSDIFYRDVRDIDIFAGAVMEYHVRESNLGPTACALVAMQFYDLKYGDRFYFEHEGEAASFTPGKPIGNHKLVGCSK